MKTPLLTRKPEEAIGFIGAPLPILGQGSGVVTAGEFLGHALALAEQLPAQQYSINLCSNRYHFMLTLCAALIRQQTNLLPPNGNLTTQRRMAERYSPAYIIHDGREAQGLCQDIVSINVNGLSLEERDQSPDVPLVESNHVAAISFTSGSTGDSKPNLKSWRMLTDSTAINARYNLTDPEALVYQLATVPAQHMWGFETSVLLPLFANVCAMDSKPLFPQDVHDDLRLLPEPRMLVSTPPHLQALCASPLDFPRVRTVMCASSPLTRQLAERSEAVFNGELREIYGCSEVGSMAMRQTVREDAWHIFAGLEFAANEQGKVSVSAAHLPESIILQDNLTIGPDNTFSLCGRSSDMIKIAGKRGSLQEITEFLLGLPGVIDGAVLLPEGQKGTPRLSAIVVLDKGVSTENIVALFRDYLDRAFVPRNIIQVAQLPRSENGKLSKQALTECYQSNLVSSDAIIK